MKKLLLLTTLFLAFACSKDDEGENNEENQTFLQKYDGMGFKDEYGEYWFFFDDTYFMAYVVDESDGTGNECTLIKEGENLSGPQGEGDEVEFNVSIVTNDSNSLVYRLVNELPDGGTYTETGKFSVKDSGNTLTLTYDEGTEDEEIVTFSKTTTTYSSLCN